MYASAGPDPDQVVLATGDLSRLGRTEVRTFPMGSQTWSVEVASKGPLVGPLARQQPWVVLATGLLAAVLVPFIIEVLLRRRSYALALVAERTAELDVAHRRLVEHELLAAIGRLVSAVGHEMRNPLGVITNVLYLIGTRYGDDEWVHRQLQIAEREVGAATLIVSDLLDFARPRQPVITETVVAHLVAEALSVAPPPGKVSVEVVPGPDGHALVRADRDQLRQVVLITWSPTATRPCPREDA
ncbi:MAG TPA: histidine kinase dimerization/phospho-acceptor domain-containing protein [Acidimicrobiales bacterium]|nr:histidine kinase dimerization/phospho-acceptor domain-containing protein [Acidimicrobiales bacterium]